MTPQRPKVRPWLWDMGRPTEQRGAQIRAGKSTLFLPARDLRAVADALHDIADQYDGADQ